MDSSNTGAATSKGNMALSRESGPTIGFVLSSEQFSPADQVRFGLAAERAGFGAVWASDHFQPWQDNQGNSGQAWITLAALGAQMPRIPIGTGVTCPTFRYRPAIVAQAFATLGVLYPGRMFLGVGTGEALNEVPASGEWGDYRERAERLIEAVDVIRQLWSGEVVNCEGQYYPVKNAKLYTVPEAQVPIYIAAAGEKSMRLAGQYGDGLISDGESAIKPEFRRAFEEGAHAGGKDPAQMPIVAEMFMFVGEKEEAKEWAELWRFLPKAWDPYVTDPDPRSIQRRAEEDVTIEEVLKKWKIGSDPQVHIEAVQELIDGGVSTIFVHSAQPDQERVIEFYGKEVLPHVKK